MILTIIISPKGKSDPDDLTAANRQRKMTLCGFLWIKVDYNGLKWTKVDLYGLKKKANKYKGLWK